MGHTSTIDHDYMVFALSEVSPLVEQTIIAERFASFTVKSRREVDFSSVKYYVPDFHNEQGEVLEHNKLLHPSGSKRRNLRKIPLKPARESPADLMRTDGSDDFARAV